jgi:hypothetical protein
MSSNTIESLARVAIGGAFLVCAIGGCGRREIAGPKTHPVKGKVVFTKGGTAKTLSDRQGYIVFESIEQPGVKAMGEIQEDGSFTVTTILQGDDKPGAVEGSHRVRLELDDTAARFVAPQFLSAKSSAITVKIPSSEELEIKVWK